MVSSRNKITIDKDSRGFSLIELLITLTITLLILGLAFSLLAGALNKKVREEKQANMLADANVGLGRMAEEIENSGFGLRSNGIVASDSSEDQIRIRANLNAFLKQTSSTTVSDASEDVIFKLVAKPGEPSALVRSDVGTGTSSVLAGSVDDSDINGDGNGDGLTFTYLDATGAAVTPDLAVRVGITLRVTLPQVGVVGGTGFQPKVIKALTANVVLRNARLPAY